MFCHLSDRDQHETTREESTPLRSSKKRNKKKASYILIWLIPLVSIITVMSGTYGYYSYEKGINQTVLQLRDEAKKEMMAENYEAAILLIKKAQSLRPDYRLLNDELFVLKLAAAYTEELRFIHHYEQQQDYDKAMKEVTKLINDIKIQDNSILNPIIEKLEETEVRIIVAQTNSELKDPKGFEDLVSMLINISNYQSEETLQLASEIRKKIVKITLTEANERFANKDFYRALTLINKALQYVPNNEKLLSYKKTIQSGQQSFEYEEQKRLEVALEAARREDLKNQTTAVEITSFDPYIDESGDLIVTGSIQNIATTEISSVTLFFSVYDLEGVQIRSDTTKVTPEMILPTEKGHFYRIITNINEKDVNIMIDSFSWNTP